MQIECGDVQCPMICQSTAAAPIHRAAQPMMQMSVLPRFGSCPNLHVSSSWRRPRFARTLHAQQRSGQSSEAAESNWPPTRSRYRPRTIFPNGSETNKMSRNYFREHNPASHHEKRIVCCAEAINCDRLAAEISPTYQVDDGHVDR